MCKQIALLQTLKRMVSSIFKKKNGVKFIQEKEWCPSVFFAEHVAQIILVDTPNMASPNLEEVYK